MLTLSQKIARELSKQAPTPAGLVPFSPEVRGALKEDLPSPFENKKIRTIFSQEAKPVYAGDDLKKMKEFYEEVEEAKKSNVY